VRPVRFHPAAAIEAEEAAAWYSTERPGLGSQFGAAVEEAVTVLMQDTIPATRYPHVPDDLNARRIRLKRFPYDLVFVPDGDGDGVEVVAVAHHRRLPDYWLARLDT
jgi:toxin ParE1/3/4